MRDNAPEYSGQSVSSIKRLSQASLIRYKLLYPWATTSRNNWRYLLLQVEQQQSQMLMMMMTTTEQRLSNRWRGHTPVMFTNSHGLVQPNMAAGMAPRTPRTPPLTPGGTPGTAAPLVPLRVPATARRSRCGRCNIQRLFGGCSESRGPSRYIRRFRIVIK